MHFSDDVNSLKIILTTAVIKGGGRGLCCFQLHPVVTRRVLVYPSNYWWVCLCHVWEGTSLVPRPAPFSVTRKMSQGLGSKVTCARQRVER